MLCVFDTIAESRPGGASQGIRESWITLKDLTVLVVDDEKSLREFVRRNLEVRHYSVLTAANGLQALGIFDTEDVDLVILDVMMPTMDGFETIRRIRRHSDVPIIILTAMGEESDKVQAFDLGADDYLTKPFGVGELLGRLKAVLRRARPTGEQDAAERLVRGPITLDVGRHEVYARGEKIVLTPIEFTLLTHLMRNAGKVLSHRTILRSVWGAEYGDEVEYLRVYVRHLRQKIERDPVQPELLMTERGIGYRFSG